MCGYCIERNFVLPLWEQARFIAIYVPEALFKTSYSIESPCLVELWRLHQLGQPLDAKILLIRIACAALSRPLCDEERLLQSAMLQTNCIVSASQFPLIDKMLSNIFISGQLSFSSLLTITTEL